MTDENKTNSTVSVRTVANENKTNSRQVLTRAHCNKANSMSRINTVDGENKNDFIPGDVQVEANLAEKRHSMQ